MRSFFLRLKHWQLLVLLFILPVTLFLLVRAFGRYEIVAELALNIPFFFIFYTWIWSVGTLFARSVILYRKLPTITF